MHYDPNEYWNSLVGSGMRLSEAGWPNWTDAYNEYRYKLSGEQIPYPLDRYRAREPHQVLEVGCGVGFWTRYLLQRFPGCDYLGIDISTAAIGTLQESYAEEPRARFERTDITGHAQANFTADLVICLEVLLHIVDDQAWKAAIRNMARLMSPGGLMLVSDPISVYSAPPGNAVGDNSKVRHLDEWRAVLGECGLQVAEILPRTLLLDDNFDFRSQASARLWRKFFRYYNRLLSLRSERLGRMVGMAAYHIDRQYAVPGRLGHSCKLLVIQRGG